MNWAVVMAGGPGVRFWPESRAKCSKPFLKFLGRRTLLEETINRLRPLFSSSRILLVLQETLVPEARRLFPSLPRENFLGEPAGRNTAPCCVYAASQIGRRDSDAKIIFLPADQYLRPKSLYLKTLKLAFSLVDDRPVLLGMRPGAPLTGYGYLEVGPKKKKINGISYFSVSRFREKPSLAQARRFIRQGNFFWNGGTFVWRLGAFQKAIRKHLPKLYPAFQSLAAKKISRKRLAAIYRVWPSISLDYGVMEKLKNVHCLVAPLVWKDLGGWTGMAEFWSKDSGGNRVGGTFRPMASPIFVKSRRNLVKVQKRLIALIGTQDLLVVDTEDALLICPRSKTEEIRKVVRELENRKAFEYL